MTSRKSLPWFAALALFVGALLIYPVHLHQESRLVDTGYESLALGQSLAETGTFSNPFLPMPTGPSAHAAPALPFVIAFIMRHFGTGPEGAFVLQWMATLALALQLALFPLLSVEFSMGWIPGAFAGIVWLLSGIPRQDVWEQHYVALLAVLSCFLVHRSLTSGVTRIRAVLAGLLFGLLLFFTPVVVLILAAWVALLLWMRRATLARAIVIVVVSFLVISPWMVRNYLVFHQSVFLRDNLGLELKVSNNDCASYSFAINVADGCYKQFHPNDNATEAARVRDLGEVRYNQVELASAKTWIKTHPARFLHLTFERFVAFWTPYLLGPQQHAPIRRLVFTILSLCAIAGLIQLWSHDRAATWCCLLWLLFFPGVYYITQYNERFRYPILWATFLPGCYFLVGSISRFFANVRSARQASKTHDAPDVQVTR